MTTKKTKDAHRTLARTILAGAALATLMLESSGLALAQETPVAIEKGLNDLFSSRVLTTALSNPWAMRWGPDGKIWLTERTSGEVTAVDPQTGEQQVILTIGDVYTGPQHEACSAWRCIPNWARAPATTMFMSATPSTSAPQPSPMPPQRSSATATMPQRANWANR